MKNELEDLRLVGDKFELWDVVATPPIQLLPKKLGPYSRFKLQVSETSDFSLLVATVRPDPVVDGSALLSKSDEIEVKYVFVMSQIPLRFSALMYPFFNHAELRSWKMDCLK
jgi:hypothetical protein